MVLHASVPSDVTPIETHSQKPSQARRSLGRMDYRRHGFRDVLDYELGRRIVVAFTTLGREVVDYAVILTIDAVRINHQEMIEAWRAAQT
jgi:hypothetical protein